MKYKFVKIIKYSTPLSWEVEAEYRDFDELMKEKSEDFDTQCIAVDGKMILDGWEEIEELKEKYKTN